MTLLSNAVRLANSITKALKMQASNVTLQRFVNDAGTGDITEKHVRGLSAVVERKQKLVRSADGEQRLSSMNVLFLDPSVVVNEGDRVFLSDGTGGPVVALDSPVDASGRLLNQAYL